MRESEAELRRLHRSCERRNYRVELRCGRQTLWCRVLSEMGVTVWSMPMYEPFEHSLGRIRRGVETGG